MNSNSICDIVRALLQTSARVFEFEFRAFNLDPAAADDAYAILIHIYRYISMIISLEFIECYTK